MKPRWAPPTNVFLRLSINGVPRDSATYTGWGGVAPLVRQAVLAHDATTDSSGIYPFTLLVRNQYPSATYDSVLADTLIVVNRTTSRYGTGWSLVGVEELRLAQPGNKILWIGGDGSARVYRSAGTNIWVAAAAAYRDTLVYDPATTTYTRTLRHGIKVKFNASGRHIQTVNRVGQATTFTWSANNDTLKSITVPPGGTGTTYTLAYASGKLDKITDPAGRILDATITSNRLAQLVDPDGSAQHTDFAYDAVGRMLGRTSRRGFATRYAYVNGLRVTADSVRLDTTVATYAITTFAPWDEKGLALTPTGNIAVDTTVAFSKIDGPRTTVGDTAEFWIDRWGAPVKTRDPLGFVTLLTRGNSATPALVTRFQDAAGRVLLSFYNSRANPDSVKDSTYQGTGTPLPVVTRYVYGDAGFPDSPTQVKSPVDTLSVSYDSLGLPSLYTAQGGHRTRFVYFPSGVRKGLLSAVTDSLVPVVDTSLWTESNFDLTTQFNYDSLGNIVWMSSPKGLQTTYVRDAYARVHFATDPNHHRTDYYYSLLNAVDTVVVYDDTLLNGAKITRYHYTKSGVVDSVIDVSRTVRRSWRYDAADRPLSMKDDLGNADSNYFSAAGLLDSTRTRDGHVIRHTYNAAGQLTQTIYPASTVMPNSSVPGDTILRTYDAVGRVLTATNRNGIDSLHYNLEGSVRSERQVVRADNKATVLDATLRYWYDVGGRPTKFYNGTDTLRYTYGADGNLAKLRVDWMVGALAADSFLFAWDAVGRRDRVQYTNGVDVTFGYDKDGHLRLVCSKHPGGLSGVLDYLERRLRYDRLDADGQVIDMHHYQGAADGASCASTDGNPPEFYTSATYDGRHQLLTRSASGGNERYHYDFSGNHTADTVGVSASTFIIAASSNRLSSAVVQGTAYTYTHDPSGNRIKDTTAVALNGTRKYFYNAIGQMVGDSSYWDNGTGFQWWGSLNVFRYDADGRRVKVANSPSFYVAHDGPNVVEATGGAFWRFVHGPAVDDPLVGVSNVSGTYTKYYYLTDGRGRQLAFTDASGGNNENQLVYTQNGGSQAGGISSSNGFANARSGTQEAPKLSYYRNRYYDQQTGRWTQEDPIGIAGGVNLYQYAGNNPATFTDPFGLKAGCQDANGKTIPCPEPEGGPNVALPDGRTWVPADGPSTPRADGTTRGPRYVPSTPIPGGVPQPGASWDPKDGHWDVDNLPGREPGRKGRLRVRPDGTELGPDHKPLQTGAAIVGTVGAAYLIYRGIRLLPSLAPPLWPTLIPNLVAP